MTRLFYDSEIFGPHGSPISDKQMSQLHEVVSILLIQLIKYGCGKDA